MLSKLIANIYIFDHYLKEIKQHCKFIILEDVHLAAQNALLRFSSLLTGPLDFAKGALIYQLPLLFELINI